MNHRAKSDYTRQMNRDRQQLLLLNQADFTVLSDLDLLCIPTSSGIGPRIHLRHEANDQTTIDDAFGYLHDPIHCNRLIVEVRLMRESCASCRSGLVPLHGCPIRNHGGYLARNEWYRPQPVPDGSDLFGKISSTDWPRHACLCRHDAESIPPCDRMIPASPLCLVRS